MEVHINKYDGEFVRGTDAPEKEIETKGVKLQSKFFEGDKEPRSEMERQLAHLRENLMDVKKQLEIEGNTETLKLINVALDRGTAILMQLDRI